MIQFLPMLMMGAGNTMDLLGGLQNAKYTRETYRQRSRVLEMEAAAVTRASDYESSQIQAEGRRLHARQIVQYAKSGVLPDGTPKLVMAKSKADVERDAAFAIERGDTEAARLRSQARYERKMAKAANRAGIWNAATSWLKGGSNMAFMGAQSGGGWG